MSHFVKGKSVSITYKVRRFSSEEYEEGIGLARTNHDYFSATESTRLSHKIGHENYRKLYNTVKPLHLSSEEGLPMHALDNGYYYIKCIKGTEKEFPDNKFDINTVASHFRINEKEAKNLIENTNTKEELSNYIDTQKERWKNEADNALKVIADISYKFDNDLLNKTTNKRQI